MTPTTVETTRVTPAIKRTANRKRGAAIFISYRRADTRFHTDILAKELRKRFGNHQVFVDTREGEENLGVPYPRHIHQALESCDVVLAVIGRRWLDQPLSDPRNWVRIEISTALARAGLLVIPVLVDGAPKLEATLLPFELQALSDRFWIEMPDASWDLRVQLLVRNIAVAVKQRDAGLIGAVSLALPAAALAAVPLVGYRWIAPLYAPDLRTAVLLTMVAGFTAGIAGWHGASGASRWLADLSRSCRHWGWAAVFATILSVSGVLFHSLRPVRVTSRTLSRHELSKFCGKDSPYLVQKYRVATEKRQSSVPRDGSAPCRTEFAEGYHQEIAIRTGGWPRFEDADLKIRVSRGLLAALLFQKPWPSRLKRSDTENETRSEVAFDVALEDADKLVCWFEIAAARDYAARGEACARITLMLGGQVIGSDTACPRF